MIRRLLDAVEHLFEPPSPPAPSSRPTPPTPMRREVEPELPPPMIFVPPELSGIPPTPEDALQGWERVVFHEGFVDYETFDRTGEYVITDEYAANLIFEGWFNRDNSLEDQMAYRDDYYMYTGSSSRDFDWQDWKQWYESTAIAA